MIPRNMHHRLRILRSVHNLLSPDLGIIALRRALLRFLQVPRLVPRFELSPESKTS